MIRNVIISIFLLLLAVLCLYIKSAMITKANKNISSLNSVIISSDENKEDKKAYIDANTIPYKFAIYDNTTDSYYIVMDENYMYVVYMSTKDFDKLNTEDIYNNKVRIEGITKTTTKDIKELAIEAYNDGVENDEDKLTLADYDNYFGSVHLDMTKNDNAVATIPFALFFLFLIAGLVLLIISLIRLFNFHNSIKKIGYMNIDSIDREMNDKNAFYYDKAHLYLTEHYIVTFESGFHAIKYEDIIWMYPFVQRVNGIKSSQSIKVLANNGKTYTIATIDVITKKKKEIYNEIWDTIINKNEKIVLGYTKENIKKMNEKVREIRKNRK